MPPELKLFFEQLINGITVGSLYAMIALGYSMVYGVLVMINFAHGEIYMVGAYWGSFTLTMLGEAGWLEKEPVVSIILAFLCGALGAALTGITVERLAYRPLRKAGRLAPLISAIGASIVLQELVRLAPKIGNAIINIHIGEFQVFPTAFRKTPSANKRAKLSSPINLAVFDMMVVSVKLSQMVFTTGYRPKTRKPIMNGVRKR